MSSYRPLSVAEAGVIMAPKLGLSFTDNRSQVVTYLNRYRNFLFNLYEKERLFDNVSYCFRPSSFHNECSSCSPCDRCYLGFTLPRDMAGIKSAWAWDMPLTLRSSWRENVTGRAPCGGSVLDVVEVRENFPTERDPVGTGYLQVSTDSFDDAGKSVILEIETPDKRKAKVRFVLTGDAATVSNILVRKIHNVILPADRRGTIILSDTDGYELSIYAPNENQIPAYKRYKLPGSCRTNVLVQGTRQMVEVWFDEDVVEIGDRLVLEYMGTFFKYYDSGSASEVQRAEKAKADAVTELRGLVSRDEGGRLPQPKTTPPRRVGLPGTQRFYTNPFR